MSIWSWWLVIAPPSFTFADDHVASLDAWCAAIGGRFPGAVGDPAAADVAAIRARLVSFAADEVTGRLAEQLRARTAAAANETRILEETRARLEQGVKRAGDVHAVTDQVDAGPLAEAVGVLGRGQGFDVSVPPSLASAADPVAAIAQASGGGYRTVRLSEGWSASTKTPLLAFVSSQDGGSPQPVALLPTAPWLSHPAGWSTRTGQVGGRRSHLAGSRCDPVLRPVPA